MTGNELRTQWEKRLADYEASGQSIVAWCKAQSIKQHQFFYWRKKLRNHQADNDKPVTWLSLDLGNARAGLAPGSIAVHVGQVVIELQPGFDWRLFREIIQILQTL